MIYKNITALALAILLTLSIVSCGGCNANENKTENSSQNTLGPSTDSVKQMKDEDLGYGADIFDRAVISIDITATAEDWQYLMDNATEKPWITCSVEFNGETFENVGLKTKGNSSLSQVASMRDSDRYSLKLKFDKYVDDQRYHGLDEVALNNIFKDATYLKEYMSYDLYRFMGVPCSYCTFAEITVNGQFYGFFIVVEEVDDSFLERNYGDSHSVEAYKPDSDEMMGGSGSSSGGIDLVYYGDDASRYSAIFDNAITKTSDTDAARLISSLKAIDEGNIEEYINVDEVLRFTACSVFLVHLDSYLSSMEHNYILIEDGGVLSMLPWDLNESFGTHKLNNASDAINYDIDSIFYGVSAEQRPIISKLLEKEEYAEKYRGYLKQIAEEYVGSGLFEQKVNTICGAIDAYVKNDSTSFNGYEACSRKRRQLVYYSELVTNKDLVKEMRTLNLTDTFTEKYQTVFDVYFKGLKKLKLRECLWSLLASVISTAVNCVLFVMIAEGVFEGKYEVGNYALYTGALTAISTGISNLITTTASIYESTLFINNMISFMKEEPKIVPCIHPPRKVERGVGHTIVFEHVSFRYPGTERDVLQDINLTISPGESVVLVGLNGAGKTTLIKLLMRLYDPTDGMILLDGHDIREYDVTELYDMFGIVFQDYGKYAVSVRENIAFGEVMKDIVDDEIEKAALHSNAKEFIEELPDKYDTSLMRYFDENGTELSIGQWQKIAIARAFYADSDILILDEPTASLDAIAEQEIFAQFENLREGKSSIFVSHRLSSATTANKIVVLNNGTVEEIGNHAELMAAHGEYYKLFSTQAKRYQTPQEHDRPPFPPMHR